MSDFETERFHRWLSALHQSPKDLLGDPKDYTFLMHQPQQTPPTGRTRSSWPSPAPHRSSTTPTPTPMSSQDCDDVESD